MCNGPSLARMELGFLREETTLATNKIYLGLEKFRFYPNYYVAVNRKVICQSADEIKRLNCAKFIPSHSAEEVDPSPLNYYIETEHPEGPFCTDLANQSINEGFTVTSVCLQIAYYLGFGEIVIIGMDHRYQYSGRPNQDLIMETKDPNHFDPNYFAPGESWDAPDLAQSEIFYQAARAAFEAAGRKIIDATVNGACTVFEKNDYRAIFLSRA